MPAIKRLAGMARSYGCPAISFADKFQLLFLELNKLRRHPRLAKRDGRIARLHQLCREHLQTCTIKPLAQTCR